MNLRTRLLFSQLPLALALIGAMLAAFVATRQLDDQARLILGRNYRHGIVVHQMAEDLERMDSVLSSMVLGRDEGWSRQWDTLRAEFEKKLQVHEREEVSAAEGPVAHGVRERWDTFAAFAPRLAAHPDTRRAIYLDEVLPAQVLLRERLRALGEFHDEHVRARARETEVLARHAEWAMIGGPLAVLLIAWLASTVLLRQISRPLNDLTRAAARIETGDFEVELAPRGHDQIALLTRTFAGMSASLKRYRDVSVERLLRLRHALQTAIDSIPDPVLVFRADRSLSTANLAAVELLGLPSRPSTTGEAAGSTDALDTLPEQVREAIERARDHVLSGRGDYAPSGFDPVVRVATKEGESVLLPRGTPITGDDERVEGVNVMLRDVTGLQRFDQLRSDLVSTVAHELRTPLTSLQMAIGLCEEQVAGPLTDKQSQLLGAARHDCDRLRGMLGDLLDLARLEGGRLLLNRQSVPVSELIAAALEPHRMVAEQKGLELSGEVGAGLDSITVDPERLQLAFTNLIGNALRHTSAGRVAVRAAAAADGAARFEIEDTGCGIDPAYHDQIFDKFFRPPGSEPGGAGLGLWIVREVVRAHGGDIGVHSEPGRGTTFWFEIPGSA